MIFTAVIPLMLGAAGWLWSRVRTDERGETTEKVIITALFAALALTAAAIITVKVTDKANSIPTNPSSATTIADNGTGGTLGP